MTPDPVLEASRRTDRRLNFVMLLCAGLAAGTFIGVSWLVASGAAQQRSVDAVAESTLIASCRSLARVPIDQARSDNEALILKGLVAAAEGDRVQLRNVADAAQHAIDQLNEATAKFATDLELSNTDPAAFIAACDPGG